VTKVNELFWSALGCAIFCEFWQAVGGLALGRVWERPLCLFPVNLAHFPVICEQLAQQWVVQQARAGALPFAPESVGSHRSRQVQVDVAAVNHQSREMLLGECKWGKEPVGRQVVRELIAQKGPKVRQALPDGDAWTLHYALFARAGFTDAAAAELTARQGLLVDLEALGMVLSYNIMGVT
jgi:hypothetical protein